MFSEDVQALYQEMIIDHGRSPRCYGEFDPCDRHMEGFNPVCGDQLTLYMRRSVEVPWEVQFTGQGCAISMAATSILLETIKGASEEKMLKIVEAYRAMILGESDSNPDILGKLVVLNGVKAYPSRIKCATLGCHALKQMLLMPTARCSVSTECDHHE